MLAVAFDSAGSAAVLPFIRPARVEPAKLEQRAWDRELTIGVAAPQYPCVIDERHVVAEAYGMVNVPTVVWIDEDGHMVRAPEPPGASDGFRSMNLQTGAVPPEVTEDTRLRRRIYFDAVQDWIDRGSASRHVLPPDEVRRRLRGYEPKDSLAAAHFRLGVWLARKGEAAAAQRALDEAVSLRPESWTIRRQKIVLADPALTAQLAATPEFWQAVHALGDGLYYAATDIDGMPPPRPRSG